MSLFYYKSDKSKEKKERRDGNLLGCVVVVVLYFCQKSTSVRERRETFLVFFSLSWLACFVLVFSYHFLFFFLTHEMVEGERTEGRKKYKQNKLKDDIIHAKGWRLMLIGEKQREKS